MIVQPAQEEDKMEDQTKKKLAFRCYAYPAINGERKGYYAICIDLNLFTWRPTIDQAKASLNDAIVGYLETVTDLAKEENLTYERLVKRIYRPAPFFPHKARYYMNSLRNRMIREIRAAYSEDTVYKSRIDISDCEAVSA